MNRSLTSRAFALALAALSLIPSTRAMMTDADIQTSLENWLGRQPGGVAVACVAGGHARFFTAGHYSAADPRAVTPDTYFEIGSVTKVFTALLLEDLVRDGKIQLDRPVGAPFSSSTITYAQLATHTSGLPRLPAGFGSAEPANPYAQRDLAALVRAFAADAPTARPTDKPAYSNFGFAVLGQALAGTMNEPYDSLLRTRVLQPLGLRDTFLSWRQADPQRLAPGHNEQGPTPHWDMAAYAPAGALVSSARELATFLEVCLGARENPLAAAITATTAPRLDGPVPNSKIGLAWITSTQDGGSIVWHNGGTGGFRSFVGFDPVRKLGVAVLTNHTTSVDELGGTLLAGRVFPQRAAPPAASHDLVRYLGSYPLAPSFVITITAEGDALYLQATSQPRLRLTPAAKDRFKLEGVAAEITFESRADGSIGALVLHQNGVDQRAPRLAPGQRPAAPVEITLRPEQLEGYVGRYQTGPLSFVVTHEDGRLLVKLNTQPAFPVFAFAPDEFFYKIVNAQLSFERDATGKVTALVLHQNGVNQRAAKAAE